MKRLTRLSLCLSALCFSALATRAADPGYVDLGNLAPAKGCQFVEVNVGAPLLKFASAFISKEEPEAAELIRGLKQVRVNVVGFNEHTREGTAEHVRTLRRSLESQGWTKVVTVQENGEADEVAVYLKMSATDAIDGAVVTVLDRGSKQAVLVNVVGSIHPEQLTALAKHLQIDGLSKVAVAKPAKGA